MDEGKQERQRLTPRRLMYQQFREGDAVTLSGSCGDVEGIFVDFRHPDLPAGEWEARPWWPVWATNDNAGLMFPYEATTPLETYHRLKPSTAQLPVIYALPGDELRIESVEGECIGGPYDHPHDVSRRLATLVLIRADRERVTPPWPLPFYGITQLRDAPPIEAYDRLAERVLQKHGNPARIEQLSGIVIAMHNAPDAVPDLSDRALRAVNEAEKAIAELSASLDDRQLGYLRRAVSAAALAGFAQGKAELRKAELAAAASAAPLKLGPDKLRNDVWRDFATAAWQAEPTRSAYSIKEELIGSGKADPSQESSIMRQLRKNPLNPKYAGKG